MDALGARNHLMYGTEFNTMTSSRNIQPRTDSHDSSVNKARSFLALFSFLTV